MHKSNTWLLKKHDDKNNIPVVRAANISLLLSKLCPVAVIICLRFVIISTTINSSFVSLVGVIIVIVIKLTLTLALKLIAAMTIRTRPFI